MDFRHQIAALGSLSQLSVDALLLLVAGGAVDAALDPLVAGAVRDAVTAGDLQLTAGKCLYLHRVPGVKAARVLVCTVDADASPKSIKAATNAAMAQLKGLGAKNLALALVGASWMPAHAQAVVAAVGDALYVYRHTKPSAPAASALRRVSLLCSRDEAKTLPAALERAQAVANGVALARELANRPANYCTPSHLAEQAKKLAREYASIKVEVLDRKAVEKLAMGAFLAVAQASGEPLRFIVARYQGAAKTQAPVALVGKGITFDTGGISMKPPADMDEMKFDMGGAASVLGTLRAVAQLQVPINLVCVIPSCENMPGGRAVKPGDVVTSMSGQTIEILNTDAEGRLLLCDALSYVERFKPRAVVDVATLTGACMIALGAQRSGLFSNDDGLAADLAAAGDVALDPCWRMPLDDEYGDGLKSSFADMANVGPRAGGAISAAKFLQRFAGKYRWAHLDIAGTAWKSGAAKGATGRPVPLLTHFVLSQVRK